MRRLGYQDWLKTAPGISPTSPSGSSVLVSAFGSGVDQNQYLLDGTSITATGNGVSRAEPGVNFIQELQIQSVGASVRLHGNVQGAVVNVITKSGGDRFQYDAAYYWQTDALTSQPVRRSYDSVRKLDSGYERAAYRDITTSLGGPVIRDRLWFFSGYQHLRDSDSQPATNPDLPREYEQDKIFAKVTWRLAPGWQLTQSFHDEFWSNPETPTGTKPRAATQRLDASVPAINFGHLVHTASPSNVWDVRVGWFRFTQDTSPTSGDPRMSPIVSTCPTTSGAAVPSESGGYGNSARRSRALSATTGPAGSARITNGGWGARLTGASIARSPSFRLVRALSTETACCGSARSRRPPTLEAGSSLPPCS